ncbi:hypothetical protein CYMTET_55785 [Cymbomonas tetramitiformis]|uniref:BED-type domain-containing protein n=1 Tax=Cymbomonas tetramitiformis TaxID=36881 RepID=A0AAE0BDF2_9CHLO|nr:hypothetical protein CYMTET_55785 [Cymbomonas tetramitiformis]
MTKCGRGTKRKSSYGVTLAAQGRGPMKRTQQSPFDPAGSDGTEADTWEPIEHLVGHEQDLGAFRQRRKEEAENAEASAEAQKKQRLEEKERTLQELDGFEEASGGKRRAACWKHYNIPKDESGKVTHVKCLLCPAENKSIPYCGNTTNLRSHLSSVHKNEFCKMVSADSDKPATDGMDKDNADSSVSQDFHLRERLLAALPFPTVRHTGEQLEKSTKEACAGMGLGEYREAGGLGENVDAVDTVTDFVHATCSDNASNIVNGWKSFDGHECCDHTIALVVKAYLEHPVIKKVFSKLRGMTTHFNHSVIGGNLLKESQRRHQLSESKPPQDNDTRSGWGGACKQATWYHANQVAVQMHDVERPTKAATAVENPDGSVYRTHQLVADEWNIVRESMYILTYAKIAVDLLQSTKKDFAIATLLDPRYKRFKFKYAGKWMRGRFSRKQAESWVTATYAADWKPKDDPSVAMPAQGVAVDAAMTEASFLADDASDDEVFPSAQEDAQVRDEMREYLDMPDAKADVDVQEWWRQHTSVLPFIAQMARQFLGVPASTA